MTPLLLAALVALSWFVPATRAIFCAPGHRYEHPHNCSAFILCHHKLRSPKIFKCPTGLHYNAKKSFCDWPENAKCTLEEKRKTASVNSTRNITAVRKDNVKDMVQKTKADEKVRNVTFTDKDAVTQKGKSENETSVVEIGMLNKSQPNDHHHDKSMKEVKGGGAKVKTINEGSKEGVEKSAVNSKAEEINDPDALTNSGGPSENKSKLEVKSTKGKTEEQVSTQGKTPEGDSKVNKPGFFSRAFHVISKRQDKTETKQEEIKKKIEKKNEGEKSMTNNTLLAKPLTVEEEKSNTTKVKNVTFKEKELDYSIKSLIGFVVKKNNTGDKLNIKELSVEPVINNNSDVGYSTVPVNLNYMQGVFGYEIIPIDTANSTKDSPPASESPTTSENSPKIENTPTSESYSTSEDTSKGGSEPTSSIAQSSTSESSVGKIRST